MLDHVQFAVDYAAIRTLLRQEFAAPGESLVTEDSYLDFRLHTPAILQHVVAYAAASGDTFRPEDFSVYCISRERERIVHFVGSGHLKIYLMNFGQYHFEPLLRARRFGEQVS